MFALIDPLSIQNDFDGNPLGPRVADIVETEFPVADPYFWADFPPDIAPGILYWDGSSVCSYPFPAEGTSA